MHYRSRTAIDSYHAHINFDPETRDTAIDLREEIGRQFDIRLGRVHDQPVGPHPKPMFQVSFEPPLFAEFVPWLMLNSGGLSIFIHPNTGDADADHYRNAIWINQTLELKQMAFG